MLNIKKQIAEKILEKVKAINPDAPLETDELVGMLEYPPDANMGDLAFPCFKLSRTLRMAPPKIAEAIADGFELDCVQKADSVNGYLNKGRIFKCLPRGFECHGAFGNYPHPRKLSGC